MHKNSFVLAIKDSNRRVLREISGEVHLPFHEEYKVYLKNISSRDASVEVFIDGTDIANNSFLVRANSAIELERFVFDNAQGKRFKFVPATDSRVQDPDNSSNGEVRIKVRYKKAYFKPYYDYDDEPCRGMKIRGMTASFNCSSSQVSCSAIPSGATIGGSDSNQRFTNVSVGELEDEITEMWLRIVPTRNEDYSKGDAFCSQCGKKVKSSARFCSRCGYRL